MNNFIMFVGNICSGKTTFIDENQQNITKVYGVDAVISTDAVIEDIAQSRGLTYSEVFKDSIGLAGKYVESMLGILSLQQKNFILDQTNLTPKSRKYKLSLLTHGQNYSKIAVVFNELSIEELKIRSLDRAITGKAIPAQIIEDMANTFVYPTLEEGFTKIMTIQEFKDSLKEESPKYGEMKFA